MNGALSIALLILVLAVVGVVLFFVVMGLLTVVGWTMQRLHRCPHCRRRGGVHIRNFWHESRVNPEGVFYGARVYVYHCERCDWITVSDSAAGTRDIGPDEEEWREWRDQFHDKWQEWRDRARARDRDLARRCDGDIGGSRPRLGLAAVHSVEVGFNVCYAVDEISEAFGGRLPLHFLLSGKIYDPLPRVRKH